MANSVPGKHIQNAASPAEEDSRLENDFAIVQDQHMGAKSVLGLQLKLLLAILMNAQVNMCVICRVSVDDLSKEGTGRNNPCPTN